MEKATPKSDLPKLVKLENAFKLAELWVSNMTESMEDDSTDAELEGRPSRLGLGAKGTRQPKLGPSNDPVERKLQAKLDVGKRTAEQSKSSVRDGHNDDDDSDDDLDSRTKAFSKKRAIPPTPHLQTKKKRK